MKRAAGFLLAVIFALSVPLQVFAENRYAVSVQLSEGKNEYRIENQKRLTSAEMDRLLDKLADEYAVDISIVRRSEVIPEFEYEDEISYSMPVELEMLEEPAEPEEPVKELDMTGALRLYPITRRDNGVYSFVGLMTGGYIGVLPENAVSFKHGIDGGEELRYGTIGEENEYPNSSLFGYEQYQGNTDNWQCEELFVSLEPDRIYRLTASITVKKPQAPEETETKAVALNVEESPAPETGDEPETEEYTVESDSFLLYVLKPGDTLIAVSAWYGVDVGQITADNHIEAGDRLLGAGDTLFLRNPSTDRPLSDGSAEHGTLTRKRLGVQGSSEYAYSAVNIATGNLYYSTEETTLREYDGFAVTRDYNSMASSVSGGFGRGFSSNLTMHIARLDGDMLFNSEDGQEIRLTSAGDGTYKSDDGWYALAKDDDEYVISTPQLDAWRFDTFGQITEITGKNGLPVEYAYDENHRLTGITSRSGASFAVEWDDNGHIELLTKPDGTSIQYRYSGGFLEAVTDEEGHVTTYEYDEAGRLIQETNALGDAVFAAAYDDNDRAAEYSNATGDTAKFEYCDGTVKYTDQRGNAKTYIIDAEYRITGVQYADGKSESRIYNELDMLTSHTDKAGDTAEYTYDASGNLLQKVYKGQVQFTGEYDGSNNLIKETDVQGNVTLYEYDLKGNATKVSYPDGTCKTYVYDGRSRLVQETDQLGRTTIYEYSGAGTGVTKLTDPNGNVTVSSYDAMGRATEVTTAAGTTKYTYTPSGRIATVTTSSGIESYEYDAAGNTISKTDANGNKTEYVYDSNGQVIRIKAGASDVQDIQYDPDGNIISEKNAKGETTGYTYDTNGNVIKEVYPDGSYTEYKYDAKNRVTEERDSDGASHTYEYHSSLDLAVREKDKLGRVTLYDYDDAGNLLKTTLPDGTELVNTYDSMNRLLTSLDERGVTVSYTYDANGNMTKREDTAGSITTYEYDGNGNLIKETNRLGHSKTFEYDANNRLTRAADATGKFTAYTYDGMGQTLTETDRSGNTKRYTYDANGNVATYTDGNGNISKYTYDSSNRLVKEEHADGGIYGIVYDGAGNVAKTIDPYGNVTGMEYDGKGRMTAVTDALGNVTRYTYDNDGNVTSITHPDGAVERYKYNKIGWLLSSELPSGLVTTLEYDIMGRLIKAGNNQGQIENYEYDKARNLIRHRDVLGRDTVYTYDDHSRLIRRQTPAGDDDRYEYDALDRLAAATDVQGRTTRYEYDGADNLVRIIRWDGKEQNIEVNGEGAAVSVTDELGLISKTAYDGNGNVKEITSPGGISVSSVYDCNGKFTEHTDGSGNTVKYRNDALGRLVETVSAEGVTISYEYDALGRNSAIRDAAGVENYAYDSMGRPVKRTDANGNITEYEYDTAGNLKLLKSADGGSTAFEYDAFGRITIISYPNGKKQSCEYDALGRLVSETSVSGIKTRYTYDIRGNLTKIYDSTGQNISYFYDEFNRRIKATNLKGGYTEYEYDKYDRLISESDNRGARVRYEYDDIGRPIKVTGVTGLVTLYTYDSDNRLIREDAGGRIYRYEYDNNGSVTALVNPDGTRRTFEYNRDGQLTAKKDFQGNRTVYSYNNTGRLSSITDALGNQTAVEYDPEGNISKQTSPDGSVTSFAYDKMNRLGKVTEPGDVTALYQYDCMGSLAARLTTGVNPKTGESEQRKVLYRHTSSNRLASILNGEDEVEAESKAEIFTYTASDYMEKKAMPSGKEIACEYDKYNNIIKVSYENDPANTTSVSYSYDTWGRVTMTDDALGRVKLEYDLSGQLTKAAYSEGMEVQYEYNLWGELIKLTYPDGTAAEYTRDSMGRTTVLKGRDGKETLFEYDENGNATKTTLPDGTVTATEYDALNRVTVKTNADRDGQLISRYAYEYDSMGRISRDVLTDENGDAVRTYQYDARGQLIRYEETSPGGKATSEYAYDGFGNRVSEITEQDGRIVRRTFIYDGYDRLTSEREEGSETASYQYDADGNLIKKKERGSVTVYTYDGANRLLTATVDGKLMEQNTYDGSGLKAFSLRRKEYPSSSPGRWKAWLLELRNRKKVWVEDKTDTPEEAALAMEGEGFEKLPENAEESPARGEWIAVKREAETPAARQKRIRDACYTGAGVLAAFAPPMGTVLLEEAEKLWRSLCGVLDTAIDFVYNGGEAASKQDEASRDSRPDDSYMELPIEQEEADMALEGPSLRAKYLTSKKYWLILLRLPSGSGTGVYYEPTRYIYDLTLDNPEVLAEYGNSSNMRTAYTYSDDARISGGTAKENIYYLYDGRGSVSETLEDGQVKSTLRYDAFGRITQGEPKQDKLFAFNGEEYVPQTGLQYLRARHYDPAQGRFTTQDTYLGSSGSILSQNRYAYCSNDPVNYTDPSGLRQVAGTDAADVTGRNSKSSKTSASKSGTRKYDSTSSYGTKVGSSGNTTYYRDSKMPGGVYGVEKNTNKVTTYKPSSSGSSGSSSGKTSVPTVPDRYDYTRNPIAKLKNGSNDALYVGRRLAQSVANRARKATATVWNWSNRPPVSEPKQERLEKARRPEWWDENKRNLITAGVAGLAFGAILAGGFIVAGVGATVMAGASTGTITGTAAAGTVAAYGAGQAVISTGAMNIASSFAANYSQGSSASDALKIAQQKSLEQMPRSALEGALAGGIAGGYQAGKVARDLRYIQSAFITNKNIDSAGEIPNNADHIILHNEYNETSKVIQVTPDGIALPPGRNIPDNLVENPFRSGSYGIIDQNTQKYFEVLRIDPPTPVGRKGPQYSHYHIYGSKEHYVPGYNDYWPW